ncbi:MarR family transcriptional regulator [Nocardioides mangrovicus]|uniref:MarR family transcriptional regulator n=2 Tax=Nocardioides mangrovicus TaxID=2478913 RepID=A0A3L8P5A4_9ACTN|nr:MarR family transcriptional regulator [Nocardioides mangrovicus]
MSTDTRTHTGADAGRLYVALGRISRAVRRDSPDASVGHGALSALATLVQDGPQRLGTLAGTEGVSAPSMSRIVASLEQLGYVARTPDPDDGRAALVGASDAGRELVAGRRSDKLSALRTRIERLDPDARDALAAALPALEALAAD